MITMIDALIIVCCFALLLVVVSGPDGRPVTSLGELAFLLAMGGIVVKALLG